MNTISFTVAAALLTGFVFGLVPALHSTRGQLTAALKDSAVGRDARRSRLQSGFVVAQLSLSLVLLVMAGMVEDEGPGIANSANLFVPFFTTKPQGSGIGLVLCRQIAEAHGGSLALENRHGQRGSIATLRMRVDN